MAKNWWGFEMPESWYKTQELLKKLTPVISGLNIDTSNYAWQKDISGATAALRTIQPYLGSLSIVTENATMLSRITELQTSLSRIIPDYSKLFVSAERIIPQIPKIPTFDWDWMSSAIKECEEEYDEDIVETILTPSVKEELQESVVTVLNADQVENATKLQFSQWKEKHPVLAFLFLNIIIPILVGLVTNLASTWISAKIDKAANVYEQPAADSSVVINIDVNSDITIIDSVPYYYQVVYTDPETGEEFSGYISKKNVEKGSFETDNGSE